MRGNDRQRVTIEFGTDDSSLQRALRDIDQLRQALQGLQGRAVGAGGAPSFTGSPFQPPRPPNDFGAPNTPSFGGGGFGGGWQPFGGGGSMPFGGGWAPAGGINLSGVATVTLTNVATVNITATTVNVTGNISTGVGGGGGVGDGSAPDPNTGAGQVAHGAGSAFHYTRMPTSGTAARGFLESMGLSPRAASFAGAFASELMPIAPYAAGAALWHAGGSSATAYYQQLNVASGMQAGLGQAAAGGAFVSPGQALAAKLEGVDASRQATTTFLKGVGLYQAADFVSLGAISRTNMEIDRAKQLIPQRADMVALLKVLDYASGMNRAGSIPTYAEAKAAVGDNPHDINDYIAGALASFNTVQDSTLTTTQGAGMMGLGSRVTPYLSKDTLTAQSQLEGFMSGVNTLTPTARARVYFGNATNADVANAAWGNIFSGNWGLDAQNAVNALGPEARAAMGGYAVSLAEAQEQQQSAQMSAQMSVSYSQELLATGRGAKLAAGALLSGVDAMSEEIDALRMQASLTPNELERKRIKTQIAALEAQVAVQRKNALYMPFAQDISIAGSRMSMAASQTAQISYSGTSVYNNVGYEKSIEAARGSVDALVSLKNSAWWATANPDERAQVEAQIAQAQLNVTNQYQSQSFAMYGETTSGIGLTRAGLQGTAAYTAMTRSPGEAFTAQSNLLQSNESLIRAERELLERGNLSLAERNQHLTTITQLQNEIKIGTEQNLRILYGSEMGISQTVGATFGFAGSRQMMLGGSLAATGSQIGSLGEIRKQITMAESELQRRISGGQSGQSIEEQKAVIESLKLQESQAVVGLAGYSASPALERAGTMNSMYLSAVTRTFAGYGDVRRGLYQGMEIVGHKLQELESRKNTALSQAKPEEREAILNYYAQQAAPLFNEAIGFQQSLESGWQERLYSEVIGGGGNYDIAAARFTHRESTMFGGITNRFFGGNARTMDHFRRQAPMWYQSFAGSLGRPQGFMDTASEMMDSGGKIELGGVVHLDITLRDSTGHKLTNTQEQINVNNQALDASFKKHKGQMP